MRKQNWNILLHGFIESRSNTPFQWGVHDCTMFAVDAAHAMTGVDMAALYRGTYDSQTSAARIIVAAGGFKKLVSSHADEINPKMAQRGDWVMIKQDDAYALAVCMGTIMVAAGTSGLVQQPMSSALAAWRIN